MSQKFSSDKFHIPIVFGVTGHRHIEPDISENLYLSICNFLRVFQTEYPDSPFILISALAEGADRIVARAAIDVGINLYVSLPMPVEEYEQDFSSQESLDEFTSLRSKSIGTYINNCTDPADERDHCYYQSGKWMLKRCDVLIALWDGIYTDLTGGTGEVVRMALSEFETDNNDYLNGKIQVYHFYTPRKDQEKINNISAGDLWVYNNFEDFDGSLEKGKKISHVDLPGFVITQHLSKTNTFNQYSETACGNKYHLLPENYRLNSSSQLRYLDDLFTSSDRIALGFQKIFNKHSMIFYLASSFAMISLILFLRLVPSTIMITLYVLFFVVTSAVAYRMKRNLYQDNYILYRTLSEMTRIKFFIYLLEKDDENGFAGNNPKMINQYIHRKMMGNGFWVLKSIKKSSLFKNSDSTISKGETYELIKKYWVKNQYHYFINAHRKSNSKHRKYKLIQNTLFITSIILSIVISFLMYFSADENGLIVKLAAISIGIAGGLGGVIKTYTYTMAFSETTKQYSIMEELYKNYDAKISDKNYGKSDLRSLSWEALMENIEWYSLRYNRPVKRAKTKHWIKNTKHWIKNTLRNLKGFFSH